MSKIGFAIIFFFIVGKSYSQQQNYLVVIDADKDQVFRVRIGDTVYNSSELGHLSIPYLKDSTYKLAIAFPNKISAEQVFAIRMNKKDQGFQLKNLGEKGWALYNWQTRELNMPVIDSALVQGFAERGVKRDDAFSRLMASVVNDTSVMYNAFAAQRMQDTLKVVAMDTTKKTDSSFVVTDKEKKIVPVQTVAVVSPKDLKAKGKPKYPYVRKLSERSTATAKRITFIDAIDPGSMDTITLFIPLENEMLLPSADSTKTITPGKNKKKTTQRITGKADSAANKSVGKSINISAPADCKNMATDSDVDSLRNNILTANTIGLKISEAGKYFKTKCFSTNQIKNLGELFASDKSRYTFLETAYPYISDRANVAQLVELLRDNAYINRFKKQMAIQQ